MNKRERQVLDKLSLDFFNKEGRMPTNKELERLVVNTNRYAPLAKPRVPLKTAVSNSEYLSEDFNEMLLERRNLSNIILNLKERIARVRDAVKDETNNFVKKATSVVRKYTHSSSDRTVYDGDAVEPLSGSTNVSFGQAGVTLERSKIKDLKFTTKISPYTSQQGAVPVLRTLSTKNPISLVATGTKGVNKGAEILITLSQGTSYVSEIRLDVDPCNIIVRLDSDTSNYIDKGISGQTTLAIGRKVSKLKVILYDTPAMVNFRIREFKVWNAIYSGSGTFTTGEYLTPPFKMDSTTFKLDPGVYSPSDDLEVKWYYAKDATVSGEFGSSGRTPNENIPYSELVFNGSGADTLNYSDIYNYDDTIASPLTWIQFEPNEFITWNGTESTTLNSISGTTKRNLRSIGQLDSNFDKSTLKIKYGIDSFLFASKDREGSYLIRTKMIVGPAGYVFDFYNPMIYGAVPMFRRLLLKGSDVDEDINVKDNWSFTYTLDEGEYDLLLEFYQDENFSFDSSLIEINDQSVMPIDAINSGTRIIDVINAFYETSFQFDNLVSADQLGREVTLKIADKLVLKDLDELIYARDENILNAAIDAAGVLYVPNLDSMEGYQPILCKTDEADHNYYEHNSSDIYTDSSVTSTFYDISYNVWTNVNNKHMFLRSTMKGNNTESPIIRSLRLLHE